MRGNTEVSELGTKKKEIKNTTSTLSVRKMTARIFT